jgi:hypothetical protein
VQKTNTGIDKLFSHHLIDPDFEFLKDQRQAASYFSGKANASRTAYPNQ